MTIAGHTPVGWCEIDKYAQKSYRAIHEPEGEWFADDITKVTDEHIRELGRERGQIQVITGGFPCQAFSVAGKRGGFDDTRGTLFFEIVRFASILRPRYLFLENVKGLLSHNEGNTFETILGALDECGYDAEWQVLNSKNYGVPQNRERMFIIGHLRNSGGRKIFPIEGTNENSLKQIVGGSQGFRVYDPEGTSCTLASEAGGLGAKTGLYLINKKGDEIKPRGDIANCIDANYYKGLDTHQARTGVLCINTKQQTTQVLDDKEPPIVIGDIVHDRDKKQQNGKGWNDKGYAYTLDTWATQGIVQDAMIRRLTPRECFRLQGFPDWAFDRAAEVCSNSQLYKQAGNSVTVNVIYEIARRLGG